jgi:hypothetical protein
MMRTTLTLDDQLAASLREAARRSGLPFRQVVNDALRRGLHETGHPAPTRYSLPVVSLGKPLAGLDLDKALTLADALEDVAVAAKLELRK